MPSREQSPLFYRRVFLGAGLILLLLVFAASLSASQERASQPPPQKSAAQPVQQARVTQPVPSCLTPLRAAESAVARALIPAIPERVLPGLSPGLLPPAPPPPPGLIPLPDPEGFKSLYGYKGPYYNTNNLDGTVAVLSKSLHSWSTTTWKVSGMVRNQTRCPVLINGLTARLFGSHGELLAIATTSVPIDTLRPGEPGPFMIEAPVTSMAVQSVDWHVDFVEAKGEERAFEFEVYNEGIASDGYNLGGTLRNSATTTVKNAHMIIAWLDAQARVLYATSAKLSAFTDSSGTLSDTVDLGGGGVAAF